MQSRHSMFYVLFQASISSASRREENMSRTVPSPSWFRRHASETFTRPGVRPM